MINDKIRADREIAMEILKPSPRDLEHGLALHDEALVIEAYGLGLRAPVDVAAFNAAVDNNASVQELLDMAVDTSYVNWARDPQLRQEYREAWHASGVTCTFQNAGQESNHPLLLMRRLARHTWLTDAMPDFLRRATTPEDIVAAHAAGRRCVYLTCNGVPLTREDISVDEELRHLPLFVMLGARMMHLTYNRANPIAGGCGEPHDGGLTDFGHAVVAEMNRLGIMVDLAHTGLRSCLDVARASSRPVVVSHSTAYAINPHIRAKTDEVIQAVVDTGGVLGITNVPAFLGGSGDIAAMLDHVDYVVKKFGAEAVCFGTDSSYASWACAAADEQMKPLPARRSPLACLWPPDDPIKQPQWKKPHMRASMSWTNWPMFTVGLVQRGYSDDNIRKIIGGNLLRVARAAWTDTVFAVGG